MKRQDGFTIIEVTLFLAVSGFFAISLLVGASTAVQRQQYRDSVQSFANYLRSQYSQVINVENDRNFGKCPIGGGDTNRGQSECVILGRYIETAADGDHAGDRYQSYPVYGLYSKAGSSWKYALGESVSYQVNWGAKTKLANSNTNISVLMYRDPESGGLQVKLFNSRFSNTSISKAFSDSTVSDNEICVYDDGWMSGERLSVFLPQRAGSADAITVGNARGCSNG